MESVATKMQSLLVLGSVVLCILRFRGAFAISRWDTNAIEARQGDHLTVSCITTDIGFLDVVRITTTGRSGVEKIITDNDYPKSPYTTSTRYKVSYTPHGNGSATLVFQYFEIRGEDAGTLRCFSLNKGASAFLNLAVLVPVESVKFSTISQDGVETEVTDDDIYLVEGVGSGLACKASVNGSLTPPSVQMKLGSNDVTHLCTITNQSKVLNGSDGLAEILWSETKLTYVTREPDRDWNKKRLRCIAKRNGFQDQISTGHLNVQFRPFITCAKHEKFAKIGESLTLTCEVHSNPNSTVQWSTPEGIIEQGDNNNNIHTHQTAVKSDVWQASIHFHSLSESQFTVYTVVASNSYGQDEKHIRLHQVTSSSSSSEQNPSKAVDEPQENERKHGVDQSYSNPDVGGVGSRSSELPSTHILLRAVFTLPLVTLLCFY